MFRIKQTPEFAAWLSGIPDRMTRRRRASRLRKASLGNLGDVKPVGGGVFEMREFFGPGWRMYYVPCGSVLILMLGGGDKSTQRADIAKASGIAREALYKALRPEAQPRFDTINRVCHALGVKLVAQPIKS